MTLGNNTRDSYVAYIHRNSTLNSDQKAQKTNIKYFGISITRRITHKIKLSEEELVKVERCLPLFLVHKNGES